MPPLLQENGKTPVAYVGGISIPRKPVIQSLFSINSPTTLSVSNLPLHL